MRFLKRTGGYKKSYDVEMVVKSKDWFLYRWEIVVILLLSLLAALLNQIPNWVVEEFNGKIDPIHSYPLRDNIYYSSFSIFITIGIAIFIGVFTEMGKFAGKYGSAIFVLVPMFVWLLSDRSDNHIDKILDTEKFLGTLIFWSIFSIVILFVIITVIKEIMIANYDAYKSKLRIEFIYNYINRFCVVMVNVLIVLMLGYAFINYGIFSLHLADNSPSDIAADPSIGPYNLRSDSFTLYIAIIAVMFALLMVVIGLAKIFSSEYEEEGYSIKTKIYKRTDMVKHKQKQLIKEQKELQNKGDT